MKNILRFFILEITTFGKYIHQHVSINSNSKLPTKPKDPNFTNNKTHDATIFCVISCCFINTISLQSHIIDFSR